MAAAEEPPRGRGSGPRPPPASSTIDLFIRGPIDPADVPTLCDRLRVVLERSGADMVPCDVDGLVDPDAVTVDALARLQLTARRLGRRVRLRHARAELEELLCLMGLGDVLPCSVPSALEPRGQAEEREQVGGVEEEVDPRDPTS